MSDDEMEEVGSESSLIAIRRRNDVKEAAMTV